MSFAKIAQTDNRAKDFLFFKCHVATFLSFHASNSQRKVEYNKKERKKNYDFINNSHP